MTFSRTTPDGSARAALETVAARTLALLWVTGIAYAILFIGLWRPWYGITATRFVAPAVTLAWDVLFVVACCRGRVPRWCVAGEVALGIGLAAGARVWLPLPVVSESNTWVFLTVIGAVMVAAWCITSAWWVVVPVTAVLAFAAGTGVFGFRLAVSETLIIAVAGAFRGSGQRLRHSAGNADAWLGTIRERQRRAAVTAARDRDRREQERVIHDTVLNTLTGIGWGGGDDIEQTRVRCAHSVAAMRQLLTGRTAGSGVGASGATTNLRQAGDAATAGILGPMDPAEVSGRPPSDGDAGMPAMLDRLIEDVVAEATRAGLDVTLVLSTAQAAWRGPLGQRKTYEERSFSLDGTSGAVGAADPPGDPVPPGGVPADTLPTSEIPTGAVPAEVGEAIAAALSEVLVNVRRHAGTDAARVTVGRVDGGGVSVEVRDDGVGFDARQGRPDRLGLRESVAGRLMDVGGSAEIRSSPGAGTTVVLSWQPGELAGTPGSPPGSPPGPPLELPATAGRIREDYAAGLRRTIGTVATAWLALLLLPLGASWHRYPTPGLAVAMWLVLAAAVLPVVRVLRRRALHRRQAAVVVLTAIAGTVAMGFGVHAEDVTRTVNWFGVDAVPVLLALVAVSRPAREWVPAALLTDAVVLWVGVGRAGTDPVVLTRLFAASYAIWTLLIMVAALGPVLRSTAETTANAVAAEAALAARQESAKAINRDRQRRRQHLEKETLPLLQDIADGTADPRTDAVRRACATQATLVRRRLSTSMRPGHLGRLEAVVEAAEARGVAVQVQLAGDLTHAPTAVRAEVIDTVDEALDGVPDGPALLTVLCSDTGGSGSVYVSFPADHMGSVPAQDPGGVTRLTEVRTEVEGGQACLEVRW